METNSCAVINPSSASASSTKVSSPASRGGFQDFPAMVGTDEKLDDEWPESIFHHVGSQSASYLLSVL